MRSYALDPSTAMLQYSIPKLDMSSSSSIEQRTQDDMIDGGSKSKAVITEYG